MNELRSFFCAGILYKRVENNLQTLTDNLLNLIFFMLRH